ncbi:MULTISPECIES: hypothetical protein [Burkholderia]|uniref:hypothetical protein n=1 Tax=Burkholderia TaxID=32008 RepID=UPI000E65912E|nr:MULTISPECIES: hypothetical protein [Burkholderia]MCR5894485.1 hypothetical protein [Burkholderia sp. HAN2018]
MNFTGKNLQLVRDAIDGAISDIQSQIGSCPDVNEYATELDDLEDQKAEFERLRNRVDAAIARENNRRT